MKTKVMQTSKEWPQILAILIGCIAPFSSGILLSWSSPFIPVITNDKENYDISESEASYFSPCHVFGLMVGSTFTSLLPDLIGRKKALLLQGPLHTIYWIITIYCSNVWFIYSARVLAGISESIMFSAFPVYIGEVANPKVRGSWGCSFTSINCAGMFLINVIGSYFDARKTAYICLPFPLLFLILFPLMPESPYYYIMKNENEKAKRSLQWLYRKQDVDSELSEIQCSVKEQMSNSSKWKELFLVKTNRKSLLIGIFLRFAQQLAGIGVFETYTQFIFEKSGSDFSYQVSAMIFTFLMWIFISIFSFTLDKLGRRKSFITSTIGCSVTLLGEAVYFYLDEYKQSEIVRSLNWVPLTASALYLLFYSTGLSVMPTLMMGELFPANIKEKGVCVLNFVIGLSALVGTGLFHFFSMNVGIFAIFFLFSACSFVSTIIGAFVIPDTQGKSLQEIQDFLKK